MDPRAIRADGAGLSERSTAAVQSVLRRQAEFDSAETVFQRYRAAPAFALVRVFAPGLHQARLAPPREAGYDCSARLKSSPPLLLPICEAMEQVYTGDDRGNPFAWLTEIDCPVALRRRNNHGRSIK